MQTACYIANYLSIVDEDEASQNLMNQSTTLIDQFRTPLPVVKWVISE